MTEYKHIFGPVPSKRLGASLGLDIIPYKTCSFDCIYCQLGRTTSKTMERREYVPVEKVASEVNKYFSGKHPAVDYVTLSGSGEPTLNTGCGRLIDSIRECTEKPVAVLTNSSLMTDPKVRKDLMKADVIVPTLTSADQGTFERIHRPCPGIKAADVVKALRCFSEGCGPEMHLGVFLVSGYNDDEKNLSGLKKAIKEIRPDLIQINTITRPPAETYALPVPDGRLHEIAEYLGGEVLAYKKKNKASGFSFDIEQTIVDILRRRPCTINDISDAGGIHVNEAAKYLGRLEAEGRIKRSKGMQDHYIATEK